ncbi:membrane bound O-acyl transferase family-domain-containing protein [Lineolata rhizophorae]|uniref:Membrane bound O-acyl transferase family-domain-containing protein n=1 Tax=Lineolata rhizophorae TaxID=578093 RepID=A0A6A6P0F2_9PEZI|nr:membrane bound O-acyl transferase family-domain-containing protein [Lineolata rhizophorae]
MFKSLFSSTTAPQSVTHVDVRRQYDAQFDSAIQAGEYEPFVYPFCTFGALVVILYLLIPHQNSVFWRRMRYVAFAFNAFFSAYAIRYCRTKHMPAAFGVGLANAWSIVWCWTILVVHDAQTEFKRIERTEGSMRIIKAEEENVAEGNGSVVSDGEPHSTTQFDKSEDSNSNLIRRRAPDSTVYGIHAPSKRMGAFAWQPFPMTPFVERLDWVIDIFCNFRGMGWNWRIPWLPPPPRRVLEQLHQNSGDPPSLEEIDSLSRPPRTRIPRYDSRRTLILTNLRLFFTSYLVLDLLKTIMMYDPYFLGLASLSSPTAPPFLPSLVRDSFALRRAYRLILPMLAAKHALEMIFALGPLFFSGLLGPDLLGARGAPWMYPRSWGSYARVLDAGLGGWWGLWWHQTFRFAFAESGRWAVARLGLERKGRKARAVELVVAFGLSGFLHACGSATMPGKSSPVSGSCVFFLLQPLGIVLERYVQAKLLPEKLPMVARRRWARRVWNVVFVHAWFFLTAPLLCNDWARSGIWLIEIIPVSPLRGMGLGPAVEDGWWCWGGKWVWWHWGSKWWKSGFAF